MTEEEWRALLAKEESLTAEVRRLTERLCFVTAERDGYRDHVIALLAKEESLTAERDESRAQVAALRDALIKQAVHAEYDYPGDTPVFVGMTCAICHETDGHGDKCIISDTAVAAAEHDRAVRKQALEGLAKSLPDDIRAAGWSVAVHNDYRLNGVRHTFWLFTRGDRCTKGEGLTDAAALDQVRDDIRALIEQEKKP